MLNALSKRRITQKLTESLRERKFDDIDMVLAYEKYTNNTLRNTGKCYLGLCPFHDEDTPSFAIYPDTNSYYCFGCQVSGNSSWLLKTLKEKYG